MLVKFQARVNTDSAFNTQTVNAQVKSYLNQREDQRDLEHRNMRAGSVSEDNENNGVQRSRILGQIYLVQILALLLTS